MKYHFVGICGVSMSALAVYLKNRGNIVQGSDIQLNTISKKLEDRGIRVFHGHHYQNVIDSDVVVYNFAIDDDNEELAYAQKQGIKIMSRAQLLGEIAKNYKHVIAVSGSHGKTTTTAMLYSCLSAAKYSPTLHIGAQFDDEDFGLGEGDYDYFITEGCEYHDSFLSLKPYIGLVLNIEPEHLDYFKTFENEVNSYKKFIDNCEYAIVDNSCNFFDNNKPNIFAKNVKLINHRYHFDVFIDGTFYMQVVLGALGKYNINNALMVVYACKLMGIDKKFIYQGLKNCLNVKRRFEVISRTNSLVVHDYAHHPTEIRKTIATFCECCNNQKILVVFQPHTYSRTKTLFNEFLTAFKKADTVFLIKTYAAREKYDATSSAFALYKKLKTSQECKYYASFNIAEKNIKKYLDKGYAVLILGAGDIDELAYSFSPKNEGEKHQTKC